jgi:hypothetical protein
MTTFDLTIIGGTVSGIIMVLGGIWLLHKGAIKLEVASRDPSLTLEMFERKLKLTTHAPALGLFIIGLLFVVSAIFFAQTTAVKEILVRGMAENVEEEMKFILRSEWPVPVHGGKVEHVIRPNLDRLWVIITASGCEPFQEPYDLKGGKIDLQSFRLEKTSEKIEEKEENIADYPEDMPYWSLDASKRFGIGRLP